MVLRLGNPPLRLDVLSSRFTRVVVPPTNPHWGWQGRPPLPWAAAPFPQLLEVALCSRPWAAPPWPTVTEMGPCPLKPRKNGLAPLWWWGWQPRRFLNHLWVIRPILWQIMHIHSQIVLLFHLVESQVQKLSFILSGLYPLSSKLKVILAPITPSHFWAKAGMADLIHESHLQSLYVEIVQPNPP